MDLINKIKDYDFRNAIRYNFYLSPKYNEYSFDLALNKIFQKDIYNNNNKILAYVLDRLSKYYSCKYNLSDIMLINFVKGYYGDEINNIALKNDDIILQLAELEKMSDLEMILLTLKLDNKETSYIDFQLETIPIRKIQIDKKHKVNQNILNKYYNYQHPICVINENTEIIDGYHRYYAALKQKKQIIECIKMKRG